LNNNTNTAAFTNYQEIALTGSYVEYTVNFTTYNGTNTYLGIRISLGTSVFLDDIRWELNPVCNDVSAVTVDNTTPVSATLSWEANGPETQWDIVYGGATATNPDLLTPISPAPNTIPATTITGLSPNTTYNAWVRSVCGGTNGNGTWIGPITFTTDCTAIAEFNENFDSVTIPNLPTCWTTILSGSTLSTSATAGTVNYSAFSGSNTVKLDNHNSGANATIMLVSPNLNTLSSANHRLKFHARSLSSSGSGTISVGTLDGNTDSATFTALEPTITINEEYAEYTVDFTVYSGTDNYIGLKNTSGAFTSVFIDNIRWELSPSCPDVTDISISAITAATATATWQAGDDETNWQVVYGTTTVTDPATLTPSAVLSATNFTLTGLTLNASYNVWVRSICGTTNGNWIGPVTFNAQCSSMATFNENFDTTSNGAVPNCWFPILSGSTLAPNAYAYVVNYNGHSGVNSFRMNNYTSGPDDTIMLVSPSLSNLVADTHILKFYGKSDSGTATLIIGTLDGNTSSAAFTSFQEIVLTSTYQEYTVNFATYTGTDTYIGFKNASLAFYSPVNLDDIRWEANLKTDSFNTSQFSFYPNPASEVINIRLENTMENLESIVLYDMIGKSVLKTVNIDSNQSTIDVSALAKGMYLVEITTANQLKMTKKLMVK